ncbi:hypothetical protein N657DRAFT_637582 [Parathielavia appendiculata]|uniref:Uncharacterized protein n=1 Tax=Parathielavia appendiculata TaxID=2587402 RepID=A0AAN6TQY1_9PEZI|nr:hypothetical protein N657DRAFT_637582 [Parathielavia appendiculata]
MEPGIALLETNSKRARQAHDPRTCWRRQFQSSASPGRAPAVGQYSRGVVTIQSARSLTIEPSPVLTSVTKVTLHCWCGLERAASHDSLHDRVKDDITQPVARRPEYVNDLAGGAPNPPVRVGQWMIKSRNHGALPSGRTFASAEHTAKGRTITGKLKARTSDGTEELYFVNIAFGETGRILFHGEFESSKVRLQDPPTFFYLSEYVGMNATSVPFGFQIPTYEAYMEKYPLAEPADEFNDRNPLYSLKGAIKYSAGHPGSELRKTPTDMAEMAYNNMCSLCKKYAPVAGIAKYEPAIDPELTGPQTVPHQDTRTI